MPCISSIHIGCLNTILIKGCRISYVQSYTHRSPHPCVYVDGATLVSQRSFGLTAFLPSFFCLYFQIYTYSITRITICSIYSTTRKCRFLVLFTNLNEIERK